MKYILLILLLLVSGVAWAEDCERGKNWVGWYQAQQTCRIANALEAIAEYLEKTS